MLAFTEGTIVRDTISMQWFNLRLNVSQKQKLHLLVAKISCVEHDFVLHYGLAYPVAFSVNNCFSFFRSSEFRCSTFCNRFSMVKLQHKQSKICDEDLRTYM